MVDYHLELGNKYSGLVIDLAVETAKAGAKKWPPGYYTGDDFEPHLWVVGSICEALWLAGMR
jgi:ABC-type amino acid transport substrate-binding protein